MAAREVSGLALVVLLKHLNLLFEIKDLDFLLVLRVLLFDGGCLALMDFTVKGSDLVA